MRVGELVTVDGLVGVVTGTDGGLVTVEVAVSPEQVRPADVTELLGAADRAETA